MFEVFIRTKQEQPAKSPDSQTKTNHTTTPVASQSQKQDKHQDMHTKLDH